MDNLTDEYPYLVDNEYVLGTWKNSDGDMVTFSETSACTITDNNGDSTDGYFEYLPYPQLINMYKDSDMSIFLKSFSLIVKSDNNFLMVSDLGDESIQMYYYQNS